MFYNFFLTNKAWQVRHVKADFEKLACCPDKI